MCKACAEADVEGGVCDGRDRKLACLERGWKGKGLALCRVFRWGLSPFWCALGGWDGMGCGW